MLNRVMMFLAVLFTAHVVYGASPLSKKSTFDAVVKTALDTHYKQYAPQEYFSGITVSYYIPMQPIKNYYTGHVSHDLNSQRIDKNSLFQIGSITKSFTAAVILQLEAEKKLTLNDKIKDWLTEYHKWGDISIKQLLNMTSGVPNYSDAPLWNAKEYEDESYEWDKKELIELVYPPALFTPPLKTGYFYSNTGYLLAALIVERITHDSFANQLIARTIKKAQLQNTYFSESAYDPIIQQRLTHAYGYNQYDNPELVGKDLQQNNLSWAGAAGGIVSNSEDMIKWVKALFVDRTILSDSQKAKLTQLVSTKTGKPISTTNNMNPRGFGLGVIQATSSNALGRYWFYEGQTLGFRALYMYKPCNGVIISVIFNSATNGENDHAGLLVGRVYDLLMAQYPWLNCR